MFKEMPFLYHRLLFLFTFRADQLALASPRRFSITSSIYAVWILRSRPRETVCLFRSISAPLPK